MKRRLQTTLIIGVIACLSMQASEPVTLNIHFSDGTATSIQLYTRPQVTFQGDRVIVTSPVAQFSYDAQDVLRFTYAGGSLPTKVDDAAARNLYRQDGEQIIFDAKVRAADVQLYSEDGKRLPVNLPTVNGRPSLSLTNLPVGVYMLTINGRTSKIVKR